MPRAHPTSRTPLGAPRRTSARLRRAIVASVVAGLVAVPAAGASTWFVTNGQAGAGPVGIFGFGELGDRFFAGDWNGDGVDTPGVYRERAGVEPLWLLSNSKTGAGPLISFGWGNPTGDLPVVGDWDGDGTDTVGLFRPRPSISNEFYLATRNADGGGNNPEPFTFGNPGDLPIAGDWNGDGADTIGVYRSAQWFLADANKTSAGITSFPYGNPGDIPLTGDWNGDKTDTIGIFRRSGGGTGWWLAASNIAGGGALQSFEFGSLDDTPVVGDWDANGTHTAGVVRPGLAFVPPPPGPPRANGVGASRLAALSVRYATTRARTKRMRFAAKPTVTGRLVNERGVGIGSATIVVTARPRQSRATVAPVASATTAADGSFGLTLPGGPSRTLTFAYTAFEGDPQPADSASLRALVRASLTARLTPRSPRAGRLATVRGRLRYLPRAGVQVNIQVRKGRRWNNVGVAAKTRAGGRYRWRYRFLSITRGRTYTLRARVDSPIYPFLPSSSKPFRVRVR